MRLETGKAAADVQSDAAVVLFQAQWWDKCLLASLLLPQHEPNFPLTASLPKTPHLRLIFFLVTAAKWRLSHVNIVKSNL